MDMIDKIKDFLINIYSNKFFRITFITAVLFLILKHYSSVPEYIKNVKNNNFFVEKIAHKMEKEAVLRQKQQEIPKKLNKNIPNINIDEENIITEKVNERNKELNANSNINNNLIVKNGDLIMIEMILFNKEISDIISKVDEIPVFINDDSSNLFAKYFKNKRVGYSVIIPLSELADQKIIDSQMFYKLTIKNIQNIGKIPMK
jgi:hypothetical protein